MFGGVTAAVPAAVGAVAICIATWVVAKACARADKSEADPALERVSGNARPGAVRTAPPFARAFQEAERNALHAVLMGTLSTTRGSPHLWKLNGHDGLLMLVADFAGVDWRGERPDVMSEPVYEKLVAKRGLMFNHRGQLVAFSLSNY